MGKIYYDDAMYELPGKVLKSTTRPTRSLDTALEVAETLDEYVQPRFEILRDKNFGALRVVYRRHAGIVQLKVDSPHEKELIANVNAADRDYAICLLHCAPRPGIDYYQGVPTLEILYFNQRQLVVPEDGCKDSDSDTVPQQNRLDLAAVEAKAVSALPLLKAGHEHRVEGSSWDVLMRPVRAARQECLSCHIDAKPDATLGVMVYAVRKTRRNTTAQIGLR